MHSPVSALRYMSLVFECSLSIDCFVGYGSICNMPGILSTCQNVLNKKKNYHGFCTSSYYECIPDNLKCSLRNNSIFNWKLCK